VRQKCFCCKQPCFFASAKLHFQFPGAHHTRKTIHFGASRAWGFPQAPFSQLNWWAFLLLVGGPVWTRHAFGFPVPQGFPEIFKRLGCGLYCCCWFHAAGKATAVRRLRCFCAAVPGLPLAFARRVVAGAWTRVQPGLFFDFVLNRRLVQLRLWAWAQALSVGSRGWSGLVPPRLHGMRPQGLVARKAEFGVLFFVLYCSVFGRGAFVPRWHFALIRLQQFPWMTQSGCKCPTRVGHRRELLRGDGAV